MTFFDLFAGAGGFSLGFEMSGWECLLMLEKDSWAFDTYRQNRTNSSTLMLNGDIKLCNLDDINKKLLRKPDVIIGGPPCQGFSNAAGTRNFQDSRNELFQEFVKWVEYFNPKFFVIENVLGLTSKKDKTGNLYTELITNKFKDLGYKVNFWKLNALEYGVPQQRIRVFFVGTNITEEDIAPPVPTHSYNLLNKKLLTPVTVEEAISDLPSLYAGEGSEIADYINPASSEYQKWARLSSANVFNHVAMQHSERLVSRYRLLQNGSTIDDIPDEFKVRKRGDSQSLSSVKFGLNYRLLTPKKVSFTIPASFYSSFVHPFQPRNITAREAARLQSFPDWYCFHGKRTLMSNSMLKKNGIEPTLSQYNQIGNAVPPLLAKAIAETLKKYL